MTLYDVLGVSMDADLETIRRNYQLRVLQFHPDRAAPVSGCCSPSGPNCCAGSQENDFLNIQAAWETLRDATLRSEYDKRLALEKAKQQLAISAEVDLDDMTFQEDEAIYRWPCRCGSSFQIAETQLEKGAEIAACTGCSLHIRVLYQAA